jgi:glycosyltransferase involved in cell wall biosynthesis
VVACPIPEILETLVPVKAAILATTERSWVAAFEKFIGDSNLRAQMGRNALRWADTNLSIDYEALKLLKFVEQFAKG